MTATLAELSGWWLEVKCGCSAGHKLLPFRLLAARKGWDLPLERAIGRLKCKLCGHSPNELTIVDRAAGEAGRLSIRRCGLSFVAATE